MSSTEQEPEQQEPEQQQEQQQKPKPKPKKIKTRSTAKSPALDGSHIKGQDLKRRVKNAKFREAIHKRGSAELSGKPVEDEDKPVVGPITLAILIFVVCGSGEFCAACLPLV
mgnify:CR=1 FL=1